MNIGMIGMGNMGTTMGNLIARNGFTVAGWDIHPEVVSEINSMHANTRYLKGIALDVRLSAVNDLSRLLENTDILFIAIPSMFIDSTLETCAHRLKNEAILVNLAKGINADTGETAFQMLSRLFPGQSKVMLSGPSIANEIARGMPTVVVIAGKDTAALKSVQSVLENDYFKCGISHDEAGVELGGILKNIYAIGLGVFDGKKVTSINFRSVYLTLALEEMAGIGAALGARRETFLFVAGLGDLFATSLSEHSHNRRLGELLAQGISLAKVTSMMSILPEGYNTLQAVLGIARSKGITVPVAQGLNSFISGEMTTEAFIQSVIKIADSSGASTITKDQ